MLLRIALQVRLLQGCVLCAHLVRSAPLSLDGTNVEAQADEEEKHEEEEDGQGGEHHPGQIAALLLLGRLIHLRLPLLFELQDLLVLRA